MMAEDWLTAMGTKGMSNVALCRVELAPVCHAPRGRRASLSDAHAAFVFAAMYKRCRWGKLTEADGALIGSKCEKATIRVTKTIRFRGSTRFGSGSCMH